MNALAILDRDGVINLERGDHTWKSSDFEMLPSGLQAARALKEQGYALAIVTNQSGIGLGKYFHDDVKLLFNLIAAAWKDVGVDYFLPLYCPHHPSNGRCLCRKPGSLLIERAMNHFSVLPENTFFVGDRMRDIDAAEGAGVEGILMESNGDLYSLLIEHGKIKV
jgi:D-glycero-D-manno-heptose 1,7-bisphosphate phosphatase